MKNTLILIHSIASIIAILLGLFVILIDKGDKRHKILGKVFVLSMLISSLSSFGIYNVRLSVIHILSCLEIIWLLRAIYAIRFRPNNWLYLHVSSISAAYIAILIAGAGVVVRKILLPGNSNAGYMASAITGIFCFYISKKITDKYK